MRGILSGREAVPSLDRTTPRQRLSLRKTTPGLNHHWFASTAYGRPELDYRIQGNARFQDCHALEMRFGDFA